MDSHDFKGSILSSLEPRNDFLCSIQQRILCFVSGFLRHVNGICALLGFYAVLNGNSGPDDGNDGLSRNVGSELAIHVA